MNTQEKPAEITGIATNSLSGIETGKSFMTISTPEKLLNTFKKLTILYILLNCLCNQKYAKTAVFCLPWF